MTISFTTSTSTVNLRSPGELIAAVPHLLGFHPSESVVLIAHGGTAGDRIGHVLRADIPPPCDAGALASRMRVPLLSGSPSGVTVIVIGAQHEPTARATPEPPRPDIPDAVADAVADAGISVLHALWTPMIRRDQNWQCYDDAECHGTLADPGSSVLAAAAAHAGLVTYGSRQALERQLEPREPAALERRAAMLDRSTDVGSVPETGEWAFACVRAALAAVSCADPVFSDHEIVELARALERSEIRDACLASALPPGGPRADLAERLWAVLVREAPAPERAEPATLLAYSAYVRGEGPFAGMAVANALEAHPGHVLATLLKQALAHSMPPATLTRLGATCDSSPLWPTDDAGATTSGPSGRAPG